jgi:hypothetical protein
MKQKNHISSVVSLSQPLFLDRIKIKSLSEKERDVLNKLYLQIAYFSILITIITTLLFVK